MKRILVLFVLALALTACLCPPCETPTPEPMVTPMPVTLWDSNLDVMNVTVIRQGRYELIAAWITISGSWDGVPAWALQWREDTLGGDTHAYGLCLDVDGNILGNKTFSLTWEDGAAGSLPEPDGWANAFLGGPGSTYYPDQGQAGPFTWGPLNSDKLVGIGLPYNEHVSVLGVWQERKDW